MTEKIIPNEEELVESIKALKINNPEWGIKTIYNQIVKTNDTWQVSEKRVKKLMQTNQLTQQNQQQQQQNKYKNIIKSGLEDNPSIPVSFINPLLDFQTQTPKVMAKMIDNITGKGLFAVKDIAKDEIIFTETPLIYFPPWEGYNLARSGNACGSCYKPFLRRSLGSFRCQHCDILFCSKTCKQQAIEMCHPLECPGLNPKALSYINFCMNESWQAPMAVFRIYAHMMLANQRDELDTLLMNYDAFATVNQAERQAKETEWVFMEHPTRELWDKARKLLKEALYAPPKKCKITKPLPDDLLNQLFNDEDTFLNYLGKFNINNQDGGLYLIHSHINHNCYPNVSIDHADQSNYKVMVRAIRDIKAGEQLFETYVNPRWDKETRQNYLSKSYMFDCKCDRCENDGPLTDELKRGLRLRNEN
ncbi:unnamed protein product [Cunninghamella blakesleeana]